MGQGGSTANIGKDIEGAFKSLGKKVNDGWETTKAWGKKAWEDVKNVPVFSFILKTPPMAMQLTKLYVEMGADP